MDGTPRPGPRSAVPLAARISTTALSHPVWMRRLAAAVARVSLASVALVMSTGCLITDPPQFTPPVHKQPFLDASSAVPTQKEVFIVDDVLIENGQQSEITFSALLTTQDDPPETGSSRFRRTLVSLYIDLGLNTDDVQPYAWQFYGTGPEEGTTYADPPLQVGVTWRPGSKKVDRGCHTATLVASHDFDQEVTRCPVCATDVSMITWQILRCNSSVGDCASLEMTGPTSCQEKLTNTCTSSRKCADGADGGAP